ncbi:MAG: glyceraldehyde 3-phosphate dehydrogenase NAD-binding domain-containing protein [Candidatus Heimdallarchaeota archaeon]
MKVGINGTGLITRALVKLIALNEEFKDIEIAQINGRSMTIDRLKDLLLYSSSQGHSNLDVSVNSDSKELIVNGKKIKYTADTKPEDIKWLPKDPNRHFKAKNNNLKGIVITAPGKGSIVDYMWVASPDLEQEITAVTSTGKPFVIGAASCTTTATIPIVDTLDDLFGIESCYLTTVHAVTRSQDILDGSKGWCAMDTQLHTTGATKATNKVLKKSIPMDGIAFRTSDKAGSFIQIDAVLNKEVTKEDLLKAFENSKYKDSFAYSTVTNPPSSYVRGNKAMVVLIPDEFVIINKKRVIIKGLYDNEEGYTHHLLHLINFIISKMT